MIHTGAGATMIVITTLIMDTTTTILIMDITITILTMGIITIIHIMDITTIIILLIDMIGKIITITTKTLMEIPLVSILQPMVEEGMILAVMKIIIIKMVVLPVLMMKELELVVMIIPQEVIIVIVITIVIIIIPMITPLVLMIVPLAPIKEVRAMKIVGEEAVQQEEVINY